MKYREFGKTKLRVSEIGFGCGNVGGLLIRGSYREQLQAVSRALELGINYFDTAASYGDGLSETNLGRVLWELQPKNVIVATKVGLRSEALGDIKTAVRQSLQASLRRLKRESVDVLQLHTQVAHGRGRFRPGTIGVDDVLGNGGVADVFDQVRSEGLIRFTGFTGLGETEALDQIVASGRFDVVQVYYNLLNPSAGVPVPTGFVGHDFKLLIRKARLKKMGVVVIRVLAGGALGGTVARLGYAAPKLDGILVEGAAYEADEERAAKLQSLLADERLRLPQMGIRFALLSREISTVLIGFSNGDQIEEAVGCSVDEPFPREWMDKLQEIWAVDFGRK